MEATEGNEKKRQILIVLAVFVIIAILVILFRIKSAKDEESSFDNEVSKPKFSDAQIALHDRMRKLWGEHVLYTRAYVVDYFNGSPETPVTGKRLMRNQEEIGATFIPYYGDVVGKKITSLLKEHISLATKILVDLRKKDKKSLTKHNDLWYSNADKISEALNGINENWKKEDLKKELYAHLDSTKEMITSGMDKKWTDEVRAFDKNFDHILELADALSEGIATQHPDKV